ncbi:MAG: hypothetical protein GY928_21530 [Colwellia sp.]|nr:hypothetical protein [Colwellia sp.]
MTIRTQGQEGQIKALLNEIQKKRKEQGIRPNTQADVLLESLYHYRKVVDLSTCKVSVEEAIELLNGKS